MGVHRFLVRVRHLFLLLDVFMFSIPPWFTNYLNQLPETFPSVAVCLLNDVLPALALGSLTCDFHCPGCFSTLDNPERVVVAPSNPPAHILSQLHEHFDPPCQAVPRDPLLFAEPLVDFHNIYYFPISNLSGLPR